MEKFQVLSSAPNLDKPRALTGWLQAVIALLFCSPILSWASQEGIQANPKRWLLLFPVGVVLLVIILIRVTRRK